MTTVNRLLKSQAWLNMPVIPATEEVKIERITI
jgi:hypothetical protein